ncbi:hypothetical protein AEA09_01240 [Lysinibacillus contaminans]|uniref:Uncharacterized protein n=1 Tax=Lysinibacillus contaminans TaxID=1293441 RepID=A0ABR5K5D6_9BACI|nr:hypothetical protein [Lysinibacillus contaminans]KOS71643.1 hypothetical protein AEA09_01240 [Lysinibacillus contaminans]
MKEVRIEDWLLSIDIGRTEAVYQHITEVCECLSCQNFRIASEFLNEEVLHFCHVLGIDLHKPSLLNAFSVEGDQIMYSGYYYLCGEIIEGEIDEWNIIVGQHCFSLIDVDGGKPEGLTAPYFQIGFEVVLQQLLPESMELMKK